MRPLNATLPGLQWDHIPSVFCFLFSLFLEKVTPKSERFQNEMVPKRTFVLVWRQNHRSTLILSQSLPQLGDMVFQTSQQHGAQAFTICSVLILFLTRISRAKAFQLHALQTWSIFCAGVPLRATLTENIATESIVKHVLCQREHRRKLKPNHTNLSITTIKGVLSAYYYSYALYMQSVDTTIGRISQTPLLVFVRNQVCASSVTSQNHCWAHEECPQMHHQRAFWRIVRVRLKVHVIQEKLQMHKDSISGNKNHREDGVYWD